MKKYIIVLITFGMNLSVAMASPELRCIYGLTTPGEVGSISYLNQPVSPATSAPAITQYAAGTFDNVTVKVNVMSYPPMLNIAPSISVNAEINGVRIDGNDRLLLSNSIGQSFDVSCRIENL